MHAKLAKRCPTCLRTDVEFYTGGKRGPSTTGHTTSSSGPQVGSAGRKAAMWQRARMIGADDTADNGELVWVKAEPPDPIGKDYESNEVDPCTGNTWTIDAGSIELLPVFQETVEPVDMCVPGYYGCHGKQRGRRSR